MSIARGPRGGGVHSNCLHYRYTPSGIVVLKFRSICVAHYLFNEFLLGIFVTLLRLGSNQRTPFHVGFGFRLLTGSTF